MRQPIGIRDGSHLVRQPLTASESSPLYFLNARPGPARMTIAA
jgi:hypothetical protein